LEGDHVFAFPYASCLPAFRAPGWGIPVVFPPHRWRNATPWELVPFSHRSASRIFIMQPGCTPRWWSPKTVTSSPWMGRGKPGCDVGPALGLEDVRHPRWGGERGEPGLYLPRGPAGHLFFQLLVVANILQLCGGDVLQPCRGRRTVAAQLGCNIPPSSLLSPRERQRGPAGALGSGPLFGFNSWFASLEREREREPSGRRVRPGTMAAAAEVAGGSPGVRRPAGSRLFIPAGTEPEFRL
jgi:hypothetical protein